MYSWSGRLAKSTLISVHGAAGSCDICRGSLFHSGVLFKHAMHDFIFFSTSLSMFENQTFSCNRDFVFTSPWWPSCAKLITCSCRLCWITMRVPHRIRLPDALSASSSFTRSRSRNSAGTFDYKVPVAFSDSRGYALKGCIGLSSCFDVPSFRGFGSWVSGRVVDILLGYFLLTCRLDCIHYRVPWQVVCWVCFTSPILECDLVWLRPQRTSFNCCGRFGTWIPLDGHQVFVICVDCDRLPINVQVEVFASPNHSEGFLFRLAVPSLGCWKATTCISDIMPLLSLRVHLWENGV